VRALVVLPTYQEAENIVEILHRVRAAVPSLNILVIDDSSPDGTAALAEQTGEKLGGIEVLRRPKKCGLGSAYRAGFRQGLDQGYDVLVEMDADLSHDPDRLPALLTSIEAGADLVVGSRYVPGGAVPDWSRHRLWLSKGGNRYAAAVLGLAVSDATSGFRAYRAEVLRQVDVGTVRAGGYGFQIEMAYRIARAGGKIVEIPIVFVERSMGTSKISAGIIAEALALVTWWGVRDRLLRRSG
jgi:dolichol-phosphate mannosyltransferase